MILRPLLRFLFVLSCGALVGLSACGSPAAADQTVTPQPGLATALPTTPAVPATPAASPTPPPGLVILVAGPQADAQQTQLFQQVLAELAAQEGLRFETRPALSLAELDASVRLVVALTPDPGLGSLAAAQTQVQFLAVGIPGLPLGPNLSAIASDGDRSDRQGFLAGYLAAVITADWRVGVISRSDLPAGSAARLAFSNGAVFFCGLCRPAYPPFNQYPVVAELASGAGQAEQQAAADVLIASAVKTVYVFPGAGDAFLLQYLAQSGIALIGGPAPAPEIQAQWAASIRSDLEAALRQAWPDLLAGKGGFSLQPALVLENVNESLLSLGRQRLVNKIKADLELDYVDTGVDPVTGQPR